jgi:hypothetical protein
LINFVASANTTSTPAATMVVTLPTHSEGDVIILSFVHNYNSASQVLTAVSEGYTELAGLAISGLGHQAAIWYKKAGASEVNPTATYSASSQIMACIASSYSGVDGTVQIDVGPSLWTTEDPGDTTVIAPSVTTTLDGAMLVNVATSDDNDAFTQPAGMTLVNNLEHVSLTVASAYELISTAGATGDKTWTFAQNTDEITAVSFALRPATGGSGTSIEVDSGSYSQVGTETPINAQLNITTTAGSYLLTGSDANLTSAKKLITETGSYNLTGTDVILIYTPGGGGETLIVGSGVYSLAGGEVLLRADLSIIANSNDYSMAGTNTPIRYNASIIADSSSYSLFGADLNLFANYGMIAISNSYSLTGTSVTLKYSGDTNQAIGTVTAGFAPDLYSAGYKPNTITVTFKE